MGRSHSKSKSRVTEQDKAVLQLKQQRDKLKQYQKRIEVQLETDKQLAKLLLSKGQKERAKLLLRKKRYLEQQLENADNMLTNVESMTESIEFKQVEMKVFDGLKVGNAALKQLNSILSIDEIEQIMEETQEGLEKQREIDEILQGHLTEEDEEAALEELNMIIADTQEMSFPEVPDEPLPEPKAKDRAAKEKQRVALHAS